ncbi:MAG TPA: hypothetical protein VGC09_06570 [Rhodopila sp.]
MAYELRLAGEVYGRFPTSEEATEHARAMLRANADSVIQIVDLSTGRPYAPAADPEDRENLAGKIGY